MSKISLAPDVSGSGTFTIAAPNSSTDRTLTLPDNSGTVQTELTNGFGFRNRIINGDMRIDQRNAGASVTVTSGANASVFCVDRWQGRQENSSGAFTLQRSTDAPAGFVNSLIATVTTADASITSTEGYSLYQVVEGFNSADLGWGTANAQSVTISFWARSSVTGSFSLTLINSAYARNYGALYTINSANTWEYKTVVIPGDTSGTWLTDNGAGIRVGFGLGAGTDRTASVGWSTPAVSNTKAKVTGGVDWIATSGATFYITGVQLEAGSVATAFERRDYGTELIMCLRYYYKVKPGSETRFLTGGGSAVGPSSAFGMSGFFPVTMRTRPTALEQSGTAGDYRVSVPGAINQPANSVPAYGSFTTDSQFVVDCTVAAGLSSYMPVFLRTANANAFLAWSAEL